MNRVVVTLCVTLVLLLLLATPVLAARVGDICSRVTDPIESATQSAFGIPACGGTDIVCKMVTSSRCSVVSTGGLSISVDPTQSLQFPYLKRMSGGLLIAAMKSMTSLDFGRLETLDGRISIYNNYRITSIDFGNLTTVTDTVWIQNNIAVATIRLDSLRKGKVEIDTQGQALKSLVICPELLSPACSFPDSQSCELCQDSRGGAPSCTISCPAGEAPTAKPPTPAPTFGGGAPTPSPTKRGQYYWPSRTLGDSSFSSIDFKFGRKSDCFQFLSNISFVKGSCAYNAEKACTQKSIHFQSIKSNNCTLTTPATIASNAPTKLLLYNGVTLKEARGGEISVSNKGKTATLSYTTVKNCKNEYAALTTNCAVQKACTTGPFIQFSSFPNGPCSITGARTWISLISDTQ